MWGLVQIDGRESCMDSAIVLQMRTLDALVHLAWLGLQIFRGQRPREGPISNKNLGRWAEKLHLRQRWMEKERKPWGGGPPRDFYHLVVLAAGFLQGRRASLCREFFRIIFKTIFQDPFPLE